MLPSLYIPPYKLFGYIPINPFGVLVALAVIVGFKIGRRRAVQTGLDPDIMADGMFWLLIVAFVMAHLVSDILYYPDEVRKNPLTLLAFWRGLSSYGGFIGGALGALVYFRWKKVPVLRYGEAVIFGLVHGWVIGRIGCTIVFDHPGRQTDFILAMADPSGVVRHNLGMYEMFLTLLLIIVLHATRNTRPFEGFQPALVMLLYAPARFLLDTLRVADTRYLGLTPGQYFSVLLMALALVWLIRGFGRKTVKSSR